MEPEIRQLVDMVLLPPVITVVLSHTHRLQGATVAQARAALRRYNDVMEAAERIFGGAFDDIRDESIETSAPSAGPSGKRERWPVTTRLVVHVLPRALSLEILTRL